MLLVSLPDYVSPGQPCIFNHFPKGWPAHSKWNSEYLSTKLGDAEFSVEATPTGRGDALVGDLFVMPDTQRKTFAGFLEAQRKGGGGEQVQEKVQAKEQMQVQQVPHKPRIQHHLEPCITLATKIPRSWKNSGHCWMM